MIPARFTFRLIRGGGTRGLLRLGSMIAALALVALGMITALTIPVALADREAAFADRQPSLPAEGAPSAFSHKTIVEFWNGEPTTVVYVADVSAFAPAPPGLDKLPAPGQYHLSPALQSALDADPTLSRLLPGTQSGTVGDIGLVGPDERLAYVGVTSGQLPDGVSGDRWGSFWATEVEEQQRGIAAAVNLLVLPAAIGAVWVCLRLAARGTVKRWAALRVMGMRRSQVLAAAAFEAAAVSAVAVALAFGTSLLVLPWLSQSGVVGTTWFPERTATGPVFAIGFAAAFTGLGAYFGATGQRKALTDPLTARRDDREPRPRWWLALPFVIGLGAVVPLLAIKPPASAGAEPNLGPVLGWALIGGVGLCLVGLLWAARPLTWVTARLLDRSGVPLPARLAARRVADAPGSHLRSVAAILLLVVAAGASEGAARDFAGRWEELDGDIRANVDMAQAADAETRASIWKLTTGPKWISQQSAIDAPGAPTATLTTIGCDDLALFAAPGQQCAPETLYAAAVDYCPQAESARLPEGTAFRFDTEDGEPATVTAPSGELQVDHRQFDCETLIYTGATPLTGWTGASFLTTLIDADLDSVSEYRASLSDIAPALHIQSDTANLTSVVWGRQISDALQFALWLAFAFTALAFTSAVADRVAFERREVASLIVLGVRPAHLRLMRLTETALGLSTALGATVLCAVLLGSAQVKLNDASQTVSGSLLAGLAPYLLAAAAVTASACLIVGVRRLHAEDLRRE